MAHFAYCPNGTVLKVERIANDLMIDEHGQEQEHLGQAFLAQLYPDTNPQHYIMTFYPSGSHDVHPRGKYAALGDTWDGTSFTQIRNNTQP